jgi:DNA-binding MarR family transcriptional regulator
MEQDPEFLLLHSINDLSKHQTGISQRDLARAINLSLGMTNALVKRLSQKGLIMMQKVSARSMSYVLTPEGLNELARRTYRYLKGTMRKSSTTRGDCLDRRGCREERRRPAPLAREERP